MQNTSHDIRHSRMSIVILNFNGKRVLCNCVRSVLGSSYPEYEIILVDNGSTDGSLQDCLNTLTHQEKQRIKIVVNGTNLGYCAGFNSGLPFVTGDFVMFLNNDAQIFPDSLGHLVNAFNQDPKVGMVEGKIINIYAGNSRRVSPPFVTMKFGMFLDALEPSINLKAFDDVREIFSPVGVWATCRTSALATVGAFDPIIFMGIDVRELAWRMWKCGYKVIRVPEAVTLHHARLSNGYANYSPDTMRLMAFHAKKNHFYFLAKHMSLWRAIPYSIIILTSEAFATMASLIRGRNSQLKALMSSIIWLIRNKSLICEQRNTASKMGEASIKDLLSHLPPISIVPAFFSVLRLGNEKNFDRSFDLEWSGPLNSERPIWAFPSRLSVDSVIGA